MKTIEMLLKKCYNHLLGIILCLILAYPVLQNLPSLAIVGGDQSQYAEAAVDLYRAWGGGFGAGLAEMISSMKFKPPILPWTGQFLFPFHKVLGSPDTALLFGNGLLLLLAFLFLFFSVLKISGGGILPAFYGAVLAATAPLLQFLFTEYLVEPVQFFVVCWFLLILCYSRDWDRSMVLAQLVWAGTVALLSKSTSPAFVLLPGLLAVYFMFTFGSPSRQWNFAKIRNWSFLLGGVVVALAAAAWYAQNYAGVRQHVMVASSGPIAAYWGKEETYLNQMVYWLGAIRDSFFPAPVMWLYLAVVAAGCFGFFSKRSIKADFFDICAAVSMAQLALLLLIFSFSPLRVNRYLLAMLPYFALLGAWALHRAGSRNFCYAVCLAMSGLWLLSIWGIRPVGNCLAASKTLEEIVQVAFPEGRFGVKAQSIIAVDPACRGDGLGPASANYAAAKFAFANGIANEMNFNYLGGGFFGADWQGVWKHMLRTNPQSVFALSPDSPTFAKAYFNKGLQGENLRKLYSTLENRELFHEPKKLASNNEVEVYYPTEKFAELASNHLHPQKTVVALGQTKKLFNSAKIVSIQPPAGKVEWRENTGILIHPGGEPTVLEVDLHPFGSQGSLELEGWISGLPAEVLEKHGGIAGVVLVEIRSGEKILLRQKISRLERLGLSVDLATASTLQIIVDKGNGTPAWDWFFLGVSK